MPLLISSTSLRRLGQGHHVGDARVAQWFAEAAEKNTGPLGKGTHVLHDLFKKPELHETQGLFPAVAHAGAAVEVAAVGRLDVDPGQAVDIPARR